MTAAVHLSGAWQCCAAVLLTAFLLAGQSRVREAMEIAGLLDQNTGEMQSVLRALNGEYILPEAGGDLLRDGAGALPTGAPLPRFPLLPPPSHPD